MPGANSLAASTPIITLTMDVISSMRPCISPLMTANTQMPMMIKSKMFMCVKNKTTPREKRRCHICIKCLLFQFSLYLLNLVSLDNIALGYVVEVVDVQTALLTFGDVLDVVLVLLE